MTALPTPAQEGRPALGKAEQDPHSACPTSRSSSALSTLNTEASQHPSAAIRGTFKEEKKILQCKTEATQPNLDLVFTLVSNPADEGRWKGPPKGNTSNTRTGEYKNPFKFHRAREGADVSLSFSFIPMLSDLQDLSSRPGMGPRPSAVKAPSSFYPLGCWGIP